MHDEGMVHGDLKGVGLRTSKLVFCLLIRYLQANVLINRHGRASIADSGLTAIVSDPAHTTTLTSSAAAGTIRWMSPERVNPTQFGVKDSRPTKKSDCYALGMVILEMLSGKVPFAKDNNFMVMYKVLKGERPERPRGEEGAWLTGDLWGMLQACWSPQPSDRPAVEAVLECLVRLSAAWEPPVTDSGCELRVSSDDDLSFAPSNPCKFPCFICMNPPAHLQTPISLLSGDIVGVIDTQVESWRWVTSVGSRCVTPR